MTLGIACVICHTGITPNEMEYREMNNTFEAISRYDHKDVKTYRYLTLEECRNLCTYTTTLAQGSDGRIARVKITSVKTWKTRDDVLVGWKFGLYEYGKELITDDNQTFFVIEV